MAGLKNMIIGFMAAGLVVVSMIMFAIQTANNNIPDQSITQDPRINQTFANLQANLSNAGATAQGQRESFETENPATSFGDLIFFSIVSAGRVFNSMVIGIYNGLLGYIFDVLLGPQFGILIGVITAAIIIALIFYGWRFFRAGE